VGGGGGGGGGGCFVRNVHCDMELGYQLKTDCRIEDESNSGCSWPVVKSASSSD